MKLICQFHITLVSFFLLGVSQPVSANNAIYEQRRQAYIDTALAHFGTDAITLQAYRGVPVDSATLHNMVDNLHTGQTGDFQIVQLVRVLFYSTGQYDSIILPELNKVPFWLTKNDTMWNYWSENHMIMWMSSDWLLHEKYGKPVDSTLHKRLKHYLQLKVKYGFYEFFSSVYSPYCLSGLLNMADFSQDPELKQLATQASQLLLKDLLLITNDKGVFFPTAGRNYYGKYDNAYGQNHNNLIYLLTGMGEMPGGASHAGGFLASSAIPVDTITNSWTPTLDTLLHIGHSLDNGFVINDSMYYVDKIIFQFSSGAYFHPEVALQTGTLMSDSALWGHPDFAPFTFLESQPLSSFPALATGFNCISQSSVICQENIAVYKHNHITLSSAQDFWKGKLGFQQFPCVANVGTTAVFPASGKVKKDWNARSATNANNDLPYVSQKSNVALMMYRPEPKLALLGFNNFSVSLRWTTPDFDEVRNDSLWLLGRQANSYVAVRRAGTEVIDSLWACSTVKGQTWVMVVGDSSMYGSFNNFQTLIDSSKFTESWYYDSVNKLSVYYAKINFDTTTIEYAWGRDSVATGIDNTIANNHELSVYPNPTSTNVTVDLSAFVDQSITLSVVNMLGQTVYTESTQNNGKTTKTINTTSWPEGIYVVTVQSKDRLLTKRLLKQ